MLPDVEVFAGHVVDTIKAALDPVLDRVATLEKREPVNGRDGLPGLPGVPGRDGAPGRDADDGLIAEFKADWPVLKDLLAKAEGRITELETKWAIDRGEWIHRVAILEQRLASVKDGAPGPAGLPGPKGDPGESVMGPAGPAGPQGEPGARGDVGLAGPAGERGLEGPPGLVGMRGEKGEAGAQGLPGDRGLTGEKGLDGAPGRDGRDGLPGVQGEKGLDGLHGKDGRNGTDGLDGFGFEDLEVDEDVVNRKAILRFRKGDRVKEFPIIFHGMQLYRGVWEPTKTYESGDTVTWNGAQWVAKVQTSAKPGAEDVERTWQMCVSRGKEGKQGPDGKPGLPGPRGEKGIDGRKWGAE